MQRRTKDGNGKEGWIWRVKKTIISEASEPRFDFVARPQVESGEQTFIRKKYDPPMQPGAALEQILPQPPDSNASVKMRTTEAIAQRAQGFRNLFPFVVAQFAHPLPKAGMETDPHSLPVNGFVCPEARALRTSALTVRTARSACFSLMSYSYRAKSFE